MGNPYIDAPQKNNITLFPNTSSTAEFLKAVSPSIATISCSYDNEYGHPHGEVIDRLEKCGTELILSTKDEESFIVYSDGKEVFYQ